MDFLFGATARFHSTIRTAGFTQPKRWSILSKQKTENNVSKQTSTSFYAFLLFISVYFNFLSKVNPLVKSCRINEVFRRDVPAQYTSTALLGE